MDGIEKTCFVIFLKAPKPFVLGPQFFAWLIVHFKHFWGFIQWKIVMWGSQGLLKLSSCTVGAAEVMVALGGWHEKPYHSETKPWPQNISFLLWCWVVRADYWVEPNPVEA